MAEAESPSTEPRDWRLWFGTLGGAAAWFAHLLLSYPLVSVSCAIGGQGLLYALTIILGSVDIAAGVVAWHYWREMSAEERGNLVGDMEGTRRGFMVFAGLLASGLFLLAILLATIPMLFVDPCSHGGRI